ncbi:MAG TPA: YdcH family protein [Pseudomonadales bacterium]|nr:YdcH family protein [Pseudomonadales bacterium]
MSTEHHPLINEFPEHRETIHRLKGDDLHFRKLFDEYEEIDKLLYRMDENIEPASDQTMESLKLRRVYLKDELLHRLEVAS